MTYRVDQIKIVLPNESADLMIEPGKDYCTLVTCTPYGINTHRLLVRGVRIDSDQAGARRLFVPNEAVKVDKIIVAPVIAIPLLVVVIVLVIAMERYKMKLSERRRNEREAQR